MTWSSIYRFFLPFFYVLGIRSNLKNISKQKNERKQTSKVGISEQMLRSMPRIYYIIESQLNMQVIAHSLDFYINRYIYFTPMVGKVPQINVGICDHEKAKE